MVDRRTRVIRASEIGEYVFCARAWWLGRVQGVPNANRQTLDAGILRHRAHGQSVRRAELLSRAVLVLLILAALLAVILIANLILGG
ncbi:MAG TPA: hypothetical protein VIX58_07745 [Anaerolineae bacterium]